MFNMVRATTLEVEAQWRRAKSSKTGKAGVEVSDVARAMYRDALGAVGETEIGGAVGGAARKVGSLLNSLPLISTPTSVVQAYSCVDLALENASNYPSDALRRVQLAEAYNSYLCYRRASSVLRHITDPSAIVTSTAFRQAARLGADLTSPVERQLTNAYRTVRNKQAAGHALDFDDELALSRLYRLANKPNLAVQHGIVAAKLAGRSRRALASRPRPEIGPYAAALAVTGFSGMFATMLVENFGEAVESAGEAVEQVFARGAARFDGDITGLRPAEQLSIQEGAAWTAVGYAMIDAGKLEQARKAGRRAVDLGFTLGHDVLAAAHDSQTWFGSRIGERFAMMDGKVTPTHRMYFNGGAWRGSVAAGFDVAAQQAQKSFTLLDRVLDAGRDPVKRLSA